MQLTLVWDKSLTWHALFSCGNNPGDGGGNIPVEHRKKLSAISAASVRNVVRNKATGEYTIVFTPGSSATDGILEVFMSNSILWTC